LYRRTDLTAKSAPIELTTTTRRLHCGARRTWPSRSSWYTQTGTGQATQILPRRPTSFGAGGEAGCAPEPFQRCGRTRKPHGGADKNDPRRDEARGVRPSFGLPPDGADRSQLGYDSCGSSAQALSTLTTTRLDDSATRTIGHPVSESVSFCTAAGVGLERSLHSGLLDAGHGCPDKF